MLRSLTFLLKILCIVLFVFSASPSNASWVSVEDYVKNVPWGSQYFKNLSDCGSNKILSPVDYGMFFSVHLPESLPETSNYNTQTKDRALATSMLMMASANFGMSVLSSLSVYKVFVRTDVCTNTFIIQPHEYVNIKNGWVNVRNKKNVDPCAVEKNDVPYFFQCSSPGKYGYNRDLCSGFPVNGGACSCSSSMKDGTCTCTLPDGSTRIGTPPSYCLQRPNDVGSIKVGYDGPTPRHNNNNSAPFQPNRIIDLYPNNTALRTAVTNTGSILYSYFDISAVKPSIKACVASPSIAPPVEIGCASVAPPITLLSRMDQYFSDTRCIYAYIPRSDLASVAAVLDNNDSTGHDSTSVSNFLKGSVHFTSTVVGCIKDLMLKVTAIPYSYGSAGFLATVQSTLRSMVYAMLILYVTLTAVKIMSSAASIKPAEYILFLLKFALVVYFVTPSAWYTVDSSGVVGGVSGLLQGVMFSAEGFASIMIDALNASDPVGMCRYQMSDGTQLLTERLISTSSNTAGYPLVKISIWDYIDCKLVNYLNFGTCNYSFAGIMATWMIGMLITAVTILPFALAVIMIVYCTIILKIVSKMVSMFVISAVSITVLVIISPLFIGLSLFTFTKGMFDTWMKKMFGYMIYPAFLTAGFCIMIMVLDSVYNGTYNGANFSATNSSMSERDQIKQMCQSNNSIFCTTVKLTGAPCSWSAGKVSNIYSKTENFAIGHFVQASSIIAPSVVSAYFTAILPLLLFAILFSVFFDAIISIAEFISGVAGLSSAHANSIITGGLSKGINFVKSKASSTVMSGLKSYGESGKKKR